MVDAIVQRFKPAVGSPNPIKEIRMIPSSGGVFEVELDGRLIHSKKQSGSHADPEQILNEIATAIPG